MLHFHYSSFCHCHHLYWWYCCVSCVFGVERGLWGSGLGCRVYSLEGKGAGCRIMGSWSGAGFRNAEFGTW